MTTFNKLLVQYKKLILGSLLLVAGAFSSAAQTDGWSFFQQVAIQNTTEERNDFQVLVRMNTAVLIADSKMNADASDLRIFQDCEGSLPVNFFIEKGVNTTKTDIWVLVDSLGVDDTDTLFFYYGNDTASSVSSFDNTFLNPMIVDAPTTVNALATDGPIDWSEFDWIEVTSTGVVNFDEPLTDSAGIIVTINSGVTRRLIVDGEINGVGRGTKGGLASAGGLTGAGFGNCAGQGADFTGGQGAGGGGGGYGGEGGEGSVSPLGAGAQGPGGCAHGDANGLMITNGRGGGAGQEPGMAGRGGNGGLGIDAYVPYVSLGAAGLINADGQEGHPNAEDNALGDPFNSSQTAGGGGSGGGVMLRTLELEAQGRISADGGLGGLKVGQGENPILYPGGSGGGGRIKLFYQEELSGTPTLSVDGAPRVRADGNFSGTGREGIDGTTFIGQVDNLFNEPIVSFIGEIAVGDAELISDQPNDSICIGKPIAFTATEGFTFYDFQVNGGTVQSGPSNVFTSSMLNDNDDVRAIVSINGICADTTNEITVHVVANPDASIDPTGEFCLEQGDFNLTATTPGGTWEGNGIVNAAMGIFNPREAGVGSHIIKYTVANSFGCVDSSFTTLTVIQPTSNITSLGAFCEGGSPDTLRANPSGGIWNGFGITDSVNGVFDPSVTGVGTFPVTYRVQDTAVRVNDSSICIVFDTLDVVVSPFIIVPEALCELQGLDTFFMVDTAGAWSGTGIIDTIGGVFDPFLAGPGVHEICYTIRDTTVDCAKAAGLATICDSVEVIKAPFVSAGADRTICENEVITIGGSPTIQGGTPPFTLKWMPNTSFIDSDTVSNPRVRPTATITYSVQLTDNSGCSMIDTVKITIANKLTVDAGKDTIICNEASIIIGGDPTANDGLEPYFYEWQPSIHVAGSHRVPNPSVAPPTNTFFTVSVRDMNGCEVQDTVLVRVNDFLSANAGVDVGICVQSCDNIGSQNAAVGGTGPYTYSWTPSTFLDSTDVAEPEVCPTFRGTQIYTLEVIDSIGCQAFDSVIVTNFSKPEVNAGEDKGLCPGDSVQLNAIVTGGTPEYVYVWQPFDSIVNERTFNPTVFPVEDTDYIVFVRDENACRDSDTISVLMFELPTADAGMDQTICEKEDVILGGAPPIFGGAGDPYIYSWSPAATLDNGAAPNPVAIPEFTTKYTLVGVDDNGCVATDSVIITVVKKVDVGLQVLEQTPFCENDDRVELFISPAGGQLRGTGITGQGFRFSQSYKGDDVLIKDNDVTGVVASFIVKNAPGDVLGEDIYLSSVEINIEHESVGELRALLMSPNGSIIDLFNNPGAATVGNGCDKPNLRACFVLGDDRASSIEDICSDGSVAILGTFTGFEDLNLLNDGGTADGQWQLFLYDLEAGNTGKLTDFKLNFGTPASFSPSEVGLGQQLISYTYTDCFGCNNAVSTEIEVFSNPVADAGLDQSIRACQNNVINIGAADGASVTGGTPPYKISWLPETGLNNPSSFNPRVEVDSISTYTLVVTDANNCVSNTDSIIIDIDPAPAVSFIAELVRADDAIVEFQGVTDIDNNIWEWEFRNGANILGISSLENPQFEFPRQGSYKVCLTVINPVTKCSSRRCETVVVNNNLLDIENYVDELVFELYPSLVSNQLTIEMNSQFTGNNAIKIYSLNGRLVWQQPANTVNQKYIIDVHDWSEGVYIVNVVTSSGVVTQRFTKL